MNIEALQLMIEGLIFSSHAPLDIDKIHSVLSFDTELSRSDIEKALLMLEANYQTKGIHLKRVNNSYYFVTNPIVAPYILKLNEEKPPKYSKAVLETLAIIAYKQPVTRGDIEEIRGVAVSSYIMKVLMDREWITGDGYRETPGRPQLYVTTDAFLSYFQLTSLSDLPEIALS
jgi:segregation and condensation protein B